MNRNIQLNINGIKNKDVTEQAGELQKRGTTLYQDMARGNKSELYRENVQSNRGSSNSHEWIFRLSRMSKFNCFIFQYKHNNSIIADLI